MKTVAEILRWRARQHPDRVAILHEGRRTSWAELDRASSRVANALLELGLRPRERVCVLDKGHDRFFEVIFGIAKAGGVFSPVNWRLAPPEIAFVLDDAGSPLLFVGDAFSEAVSSVEQGCERLRRVVSFGEGPRHWMRYADLIAAADEQDPLHDTAETETAWQLYSSGTTGHPKGAELTHRNLLSICATGQSGFGEAVAGDVALVCMPLYHIGGSGYALGMLYSGCTCVVTREAEPKELLRLIETERVTHAFLVPALMNLLLQAAEDRRVDLTSLRAILYGASPIPEELLVRSLEVFGCGFIQAYGLTETTGAITLLGAADHVVGSPRLRSCGRPIFGHRVRVVDAEGVDCPTGTVGEILIRGEQVMKGYWSRPEATAEAIRDGWFHSGDAGYLDEEGYLYIHDRVKDMIVSGGENVYPAEVESVLFAHPDVADVAVIGVPDAKWGEAVKAVVVRRDGAGVGEEELIEHCRGKIAGFKRPRSVDFVDALPRNPTGKLLKRELREHYWAGQARRVN